MSFLGFLGFVVVVFIVAMLGFGTAELGHRWIRRRAKRRADREVARARGPIAPVGPIPPWPRSATSHYRQPDADMYRRQRRVIEEAEEILRQRRAQALAAGDVIEETIIETVEIIDEPINALPFVADVVEEIVDVAADIIDSTPDISFDSDGF